MTQVDTPLLPSSARQTKRFTLVSVYVVSIPDLLVGDNSATEPTACAGLPTDEPRTSTYNSSVVLIWTGIPSVVEMPRLHDHRPKHVGAPHHLPYGFPLDVNANGWFPTFLFLLSGRGREMFTYKERAVLPNVQPTFAA